MKRFTQTLSVFATLGWFVLASASAHAQSRVQAAIENPSSEINDAFILLKVDAPENEVKYFWSNSGTDTTSNICRGLTEGIGHSVRVQFADGSSETLEIEIPAESVAEKFNGAFTPLVGSFASILLGDPFAALGLYDNQMYNNAGEPMLNPNGTAQTKSIPFIVVWLVLGALFFTFRMKFINLRGFRHAIQLARGKYDEPDAPGEVTHFQALATAVSATVGLGNIAGVAVAISIGGAGATFWMIVAGLIGMSSKFVECTLGVKYRDINADGVVSGGPMHYLKKGLAKRNLGGLGKGLAALFAVLAIGASFGGGNMFQANQAYSQMSEQFPVLSGAGPYFGVVLAILVGAVIIGGIKSIARVTEKIVPFMAGIYILASLVIVVINIDQIGYAFSEIITGAFNPPAMRGGVIGVLIMGFRRAAFSNEAGVGSASIAHSAAKTRHPVAEGFVGLLEPFIDTVVVCTLTALVLIFSGYHEVTTAVGAKLTSEAFGSVISWFPYVLTLAIFLFAFSTMISWSYYGMKGWTYLFGQSRKSELTYKLIYLVFVVVGSSVSLGAVLDFSDMMILAMAFPNIAGMLILSGEVRSDLRIYMERLKNNQLFTTSKNGQNEAKMGS
jgi:AGCS family alanine or glycine:cation symporter